jgi:hypothetical protein
MVSAGGVAVKAAEAAGGWAMELVGRLRPSGTAAEAMREAFTNPRREICCAIV